MQLKTILFKMEDYPNRSFMIFNVSELGQIDFTQVLETSEETKTRYGL
jgi:hypothetical protein